MIYEEPNHDELVDRLDPVRLGHEAGEKNLPRPDAARDAHERPITDELMQIRDRNEEVFHGILDESRKNEHEALSFPWRAQMDEAVKEAESESERELAADQLKEERFAMNRRRDDLNRFRREHDIHSEASYPGDTAKLWTALLIVLVFLLESGMNATFLAVGSAQGLFGGWTLAFGFSLVNIGVSFWPFGMFIRHVNHIQPLHQAWGWTAGAIWFGLVATLNLMLGHFREASAAAGGEADLNIGFEAWRSFAASPLGLGETQSWLVTGLGLFFASMALYKGYAWDDRYPRYGKKHREFAAVQKRYQQLTEDTVAVLGEIRAEAVAKVEAIAESVRNQPVRLGKIRKTRVRSTRQYNEMLERLETVGSDIVTQYREANHSVRTDDELPLCHQTPWTLGVEPVSPDADIEEGKSSGYEAVLPAELHRVHQEACDRIQAAFDGHKSALRNTDERTARPGVMGLKARTGPRAVAGTTPAGSKLVPVPPGDKS